jgi:hypothetical protein
MEGKGMHIGELWKYQKETDHQEDLGIGENLLKLILER